LQHQIFGFICHFRSLTSPATRLQPIPIKTYAANRGQDRRGSHISAANGVQKRCRHSKATRIRIDWPAASLRRILPGKQEKIAKIALKARGFRSRLGEVFQI
jgi:hypothetical protein